MRVTAGILTIIVGFAALPTIQSLVEMFGETVESAFVPLCLLVLGIIILGAISIFSRRRWWLALTGAYFSICVSITFTITSLLAPAIPFSEYANPSAAFIGSSIPGIIVFLMGILAVIFLTKRKYEFE